MKRFYEDRYFDYLRSIEQPSELQQLLKEVEAEIKSIVGSDPFEPYRKERTENKTEQIDTLLAIRQHILDKLFRGTPQEVKRFEKVNDLLLKLTEKMYKRTGRLYRTLLTYGKDDTFDDDYEVEGRLMCNVDYPPEEVEKEENKNVLQLEDDDYYGSDFPYMIALITTHLAETEGSFGENIESCRIYHRKGNTSEMSDKELDCSDEMNDGTTWAECQLCIPQLNHICMCYAIHSMCTHHCYAMADVVRINNYWVEVTLKCQHIVNQDEKRTIFE